MIENVIDIHAHFPVKHEPFREHRKVNPKVLAYQQLLRKKWRENFKFEDEHAETDHPGNEKQSERWQEELKTNRIQKIVFVTGGGNEVLADIVKKSNNQFIGFAHHDLSSEGAYERVKDAVEKLGLKGYKWFGPLMRKPFDSPDLEPFWEYLNKHKLPWSGGSRYTSLY